MAKAAKDGAQSIHRAVLILRLIARQVPQGMRLAMLSKRSGLPHPTVRRILKCLVDERLVVHDADSRLYRLGPLNFELGLASQQRNDFQTRMRPVIRRIAERSGETTYCFMRSGSEVVCLDRVEGPSLNSITTFKVGGRRPFGVSAASLPIFAVLDDDEIERVMDGVDSEIASNPRISRESIWRSIRLTRERGFGVTRDTFVVGVSAIGVAVPPIEGITDLAVSVAAMTDHLVPARIDEIHEIIREELRQLT